MVKLSLGIKLITFLSVLNLDDINPNFRIYYPLNKKEYERCQFLTLACQFFFVS